MPIGLLTRKAKEVNKVVLLPVAEIEPNRNQPRKYFDPQALQELSHSIVTNGLLQPVTVREHPMGGYELIAGERRLRAFKNLGRELIPAIVERFSDEDSAVLALIENLQRRDLNFFEEAAAIAKLMQEQGLTQLQVSQKLGKAQSTIANKLRLLKYPRDVQDRMLSAGLTERHARAMLKLPDPADSTHIDYVIGQQLNVEQTERYVQTVLAGNEKGRSTRLFIIKDMRIFLNSVNRAVKMMQGAGVEVDCQKVETEDQVQILISMPKSSVYQKRNDSEDTQQRFHSV